MAPVDDSTRLKDLDGSTFALGLPYRTHRLVFSKDGHVELTSLKPNAPPICQSLCTDLFTRRDTLTIDELFVILRKSLCREKLDSDWEGYELDIRRLESLTVLSSSIATYVNISDNIFLNETLSNDNYLGMPLSWHHAFSIMNITRLKKLSLHFYELLDLPSVFKQDQVCWARSGFLSVPKQYTEAALNGFRNLPCLMCNGSDQIGWYAIKHHPQDDHDVEFVEGCFGAGCFGPSQNPLNIVDVEPFGIEEIPAPKDTPSSKDNEVNVGPPSLARKSVTEVRPDIKDFGPWLETVTHAVNVYHGCGYILPDAAYERLETAFKQRLKDVDRYQHSKALTALVTAVPGLKSALPGMINPESLEIYGDVPPEMWLEVYGHPESGMINPESLEIYGDVPPEMWLEVYGHPESGMINPESLEIYGDVPPEIWLEIFKFLKAKDQANTMVVHRRLFEHLALFTASFPELHKHLTHLIPLALGGEKVVMQIGENFIDTLVRANGI